MYRKMKSYIPSGVVLFERRNHNSRATIKIIRTPTPPTRPPIMGPLLLEPPLLLTPSVNNIYM